jgi:hypothetical protein
MYVFSCNCISSCRNLPQKKLHFFSFLLCLSSILISCIYFNLYLSLSLCLASSFMRAIGGAIEVLFALYLCPSFSLKMTTISCSFLFTTVQWFLYIRTQAHIYQFLDEEKRQKIFQNSFCHVTVYIVTILFLFFAVMGAKHSHICHSVWFKVVLFLQQCVYVYFWILSLSISRPWFTYLQ